MAETPKKPTRTDRIKKRNANIRKRYHDLGIKPTWYKHEKIMEILTEEHPELTEETLGLIISKTGYYKNM